MSETKLSFEDYRDAVGDIIEPLPVGHALNLLLALVMGEVAKCEDPHRALLAVIADLTDTARLLDDETLCMEHWIKDAWQE